MAVAVCVGVHVAVGVEVCVAVADAVGVAVAVLDSLHFRPRLPRTGASDVAVRVGVAVRVAVGVEVALGDGDAVGVAVRVGVRVGVAVGVCVGVAVLVGVGPEPCWTSVVKRAWSVNVAPPCCPWAAAWLSSRACTDGTVTSMLAAKLPPAGSVPNVHVIWLPLTPLGGGSAET